MNNIKVVSFRPGVIANGTAFEAMANIYKYIQNKYNYEFTIVKGETDNFKDDELEIVTIPTNSYKSILRSPIPKNYLSFRKHLNKTLKSADILLGCDPTIYQQGVWAANYAKKVGIPFAFDASISTMGRGDSLKWKIQKKFAESAIKNTDKIWITSPKVAERYKDLKFHENDIAAKYVVMGHPVDMTKFIRNNIEERSGKFIILTIGRLVMEKGIHYIIVALAPLMKLYPDIELHIVGTGGAKPFLEQLANEYDVINQIKFIGALAHSDIPNIYKQADLFISHPVSMSYWEEYFGVVNVEAMASGLPLITSFTGGVTYLAREDGVCIFVQERDVSSLTKAVNKVYKDKEYRTRLAEAGYEYVNKNYSLPLLAEKYKLHLDSLYKKRKSN